VVVRKSTPPKGLESIAQGLPGVSLGNHQLMFALKVALEAETPKSDFSLLAAVRFWRLYRARRNKTNHLFNAESEPNGAKTGHSLGFNL
jgi:hypothetical protein